MCYELSFDIKMINREHKKNREQAIGRSDLKTPSPSKVISLSLSIMNFNLGGELKPMSFFDT